MTTQGLPLIDLPPYTAEQSRSRPPPRELTDHTFELKDGKGRTWLVLNVASRAPSSSCLPHFYEGDLVNGSVSLDLVKETQLKSIAIVVCGEIIATHNVRYTFLQLTQELWSASSNLKRVVSGASSSDQHSKSKLSGQFSWKFSLTLPSEVELKYQRSMHKFHLPASFYVRGARVTIRYRIYAALSRGLLQVNSEVGSQIAYTPIIRPEPPSIPRQLSYQAKKPLIGPDGDSEGWYQITPVALRGSLFSNRKVEAQLTLWLAKPLCYTRGSVIPLLLDIACSDHQALDVLSSLKAPQVRLIRTLSMGYDADWGRAGYSTCPIDLKEESTPTTTSGDVVEDLQTAVWWEPERRLPVGDRRILQGEIHLAGSLPPSSQMGYFSVSYVVALYPSEAVAFSAAWTKKRPLRSDPISIATAYPRCPRPIAYTPPDYASLHSDSTANSRTYDAIVYG